MSNLKNILRDVGYFSVGAAAVLIEAGSKAAKALVRKGEKTLCDNQDTVDDLKQKAKVLAEKAKDAFEKATTAEEPAVEEPAADEPECPCEPAVDKPAVEEPAVDKPAADEPECPCEPACDEPARPAAPEVVYHADAAAEEGKAAADDPEITING